MHFHAQFQISSKTEETDVERLLARIALPWGARIISTESNESGVLCVGEWLPEFETYAEARFLASTIGKQSHRFSIQIVVEFCSYIDSLGRTCREFANLYYTGGNHVSDNTRTL